MQENERGIRPVQDKLQVMHKSWYVTCHLVKQKERSKTKDNLTTVLKNKDAEETKNEKEYGNSFNLYARYQPSQSSDSGTPHFYWSIHFENPDERRNK